MENFYNFNAQCSQTKIPTPIELKEIKQMLLSGDRDKILQSVENIKTFTGEEESLCEIIRADIAEFLCDAVTPFDVVILSAINNCLELMAKHLEFYTHNHSFYAIESIMRSLHFLMKDSYSGVNLNQSLALLAVVLQGYNTHGVTPEQKTIENVLLLLPKIQKTVTLTINSKYQIGLVILSLADLNISKWSHKANETILTCFCSWFNFPKEILESEHPMREKLILLTTNLCHSVIRAFDHSLPFFLSDFNLQAYPSHLSSNQRQQYHPCLVSNESSMEEFFIEVDSQLKSEIIFNVCEFFINFGAPYFDNVSFEVETNPCHLESFYQAILYFYSDNLPHKNRLTHGLSEVGFLQFTTRVISFDEISRTQKLRKLCILVLFHMVLSLSEDVFHFPEVWPPGRDNFRSEIQKGIVELPLDPSQWLDALTSRHSTPSCKLALLLYLYFYCMTAKSQALLQVIYPAIVTFIRSSTGIESSILLVKTIWFIFVMSQLSMSENVSLDNETDASEEIVSLLETQEDFCLVYTHHPAILYWAFSSKISTNIQIRVVHLWLRNKTPDCRELEELIGKSSDVRYAILDILQNGWGQVLDSAFSSMKSILINSDDDDLACNIWFLLPQVLAKFTTEAISATNVDYLIELSSLKCPKTADVTRIIRIASLLPEVLKSDLISIVPSLTLALNLLRLSLKMEDHRAVLVFLRFDSFLKKIMDGLNANVADISLCSVRILTLLWMECGRVKKPENYEKIKMSKETLLQIFETNSEQVLSGGLDFLEQVLLTNFQSAFFLIENVDLDFLDILFLEIQNISIKTSVELSDKSWHCLKIFLNVRIQDEPVQDDLATHPVLHELIRYFLPRLKESRNMADFLVVWMNVCRKKLKNPCYGRRIFGQFFGETMQMIARSLVEDYAPERQTLLEKVSEIVLDLNH